MAGKETGKQKTARIPLDYYQRGDALARWKLLLAVGAAIAAGGWALVGTRQAANHHSPGPVASVHAPWEANCEACHKPFVPIRSDAWLADASGALELDAKCQKCHPTADHHAVARKQDVAHCSGCHREHAGREVQLTRTADKNCTTCHEDLLAHTTKPETIVADGKFAFKRVLSFAAGVHPEFRGSANDPGKLKFSHRRHLAPGLNWGANDRFKPQRLRDLPATDRERYRKAGATDDDLVYLNCGDCHQPSAATSMANNLSGSLTPKRAIGATMQPVSFENHCRACHPLNYAPASPGSAAAPQLVEHGLAPDKLKAFLEGVFARRVLDENPTLLEEKAVDRELPGKASSLESPKLREALDKKLRVAETFLRGRCSQCHELADMPTQSPVVPTKTPTVWLTHARFDHASHRAWACQHCHKPQAADQPNYLLATWRPGEHEPALDHTDVLIPGLSNCLECHTDRPVEGTAGRARNDCVECHSYHGGDYWKEIQTAAAKRAILPTAADIPERQAGQE